MATDAADRFGIRVVRSAPLRLGLALVAVATVLADSSVVVLALPDVLASFDVSIERVSWVITAFNLVLALGGGARRLPGARGQARAGWSRPAWPASRSPRRSAPWPGASTCCSPRAASRRPAARAVVCAALRMLPRLLGSPARGVGLGRRPPRPARPSGPAAGGALTQAFTWRGVFAAQVPLALVPLAAALHAGASRRAEVGRRRDAHASADRRRTWPSPSSRPRSRRRSSCSCSAGARLGARRRSRPPASSP